ncbi:MAG: hypothetical protein Q4G27_04810 [Flavobacteriaceae bacterium]|nr:hypothetical protein [Flavobacteriaceae bacterium]
MNTLKNTAIKLNEFQNYRVIGLICEKIAINPQEYDVNEMLVTKPILVLEKDDEMIMLSFHAQETSRKNLKFYFRKVKTDFKTNLKNELNINETLLDVKHKGHQYYDEFVFNTKNQKFALSVNTRKSKETIIFRYLINY